MKWFDIPPVWLLLHLIAVWLLAPFDTLGFGQIGAPALGTFLIIAGISLMLMAVWEMRQSRTTVVPHRNPSQLVTSGIFSVSRNPIYVGDALVLGGVVMRADAPLAVPLIGLFLAIILIRFIRPEEARLRHIFGAEFDSYCDRTRRWL